MKLVFLVQIKMSKFSRLRIILSQYKSHLILAVLVAVVSYSLGSFTAFVQNISLPKEQSPVTVSKQAIPECIVGRCPTYFSMDVDNDNKTSESVVVIPTHMTQGAGKVLIIKDGEIIFETQVMPGIWVESVNDGNGFILIYKIRDSVGDSSSDRGIRVRYRYRDGQFEADNLN